MLPASSPESPPPPQSPRRVLPPAGGELAGTSLLRGHTWPTSLHLPSGLAPREAEPAGPGTTRWPAGPSAVGLGPGRTQRGMWSEATRCPRSPRLGLAHRRCAVRPERAALGCWPLLPGPWRTLKKPRGFRQGLLSTETGTPGWPGRALGTRSFLRLERLRSGEGEPWLPMEPPHCPLSLGWPRGLEDTPERGRGSKVAASFLPPQRVWALPPCPASPAPTQPASQPCRHLPPARLWELSLGPCTFH